MEIFPGSPEDFNDAEAHFQRFGRSRDAVGHVVGVQEGMQTQANTILVVFGDRNGASQTSTSTLLPDTQVIDRAIVERFFPDALLRDISSSLFPLYRRRRLAGDVVRDA